MRIDQKPLTQIATTILHKAGAELKRAQAVAEHLVIANLKGHDSHGVGMIPSYVKSMMSDLIHPQNDALLTRDSGAVLSFDGNLGFGRVVGIQAMDQGIERAKSHGISCVALGNAAHLGRIGAFAEHCAEAGLISTHYVNVVGHDPMVVAYGGRDRRFITNPFCCAVPRTDGNHVVLDMATTTVAAGKVRVAYMKGEPVPEHSLVDRNGLETTDASVIFSKDGGGAMQPFGLHKGYGLMVMCELLGGALGGNFTMQPGNQRAGATLNNMLSIILDPSAVGDLAAYDAEVTAMIDYIYASKAAQGVEKVLIPGDPERQSLAARSTNGIDIDENSWQDITNAANAAGLSMDDIKALL
ncbi:MAG TPA: malate/lactate/ureidoglycolate dehydrogenase [Gammaproteobacteria bacterium]|nr:malate/lactate/ureidoglycolate dehydrogenase [Gammaproteobacteria bacterium]